MRIEMTSLPEPVGPGLRAEGSTKTHALKQGERLEVTVLASENGDLHLKLEDGSLLRARLEGEVSLAPGDTVTLVVDRQHDKTIYLRPTEAGEEAPARPAAAYRPEEAGDRALAHALGAMRLPVTEETVAQMRRLLQANPGMKAEEAAALAGSGLADAAELTAARALLSGEARLAQLLEGLFEVLEAYAGEGVSAEQTATPAAERPLPDVRGAVQTAQELPTPPAPEGASAPVPGQEGSAPTAQGEGGPVPASGQEPPAPTARGEGGAVPPAGQESSAPTAKGAGEPALGREGFAPVPEEGPVPARPQDGAAALRQDGAPRMSVPARVSGEGQVPMSGAREIAAGGPETARPTEQADHLPYRAEVRGTRGDGAPGVADNGRGEATAKPGLSALLSALARDPAAHRMTREGLARLTQTVEAVTAELEQAGDGRDLLKALPRFLGRVFARLEEGAAGAELGRARQELYLRLSALEQALARTRLPGREAALAQTRGLLDQIRLQGRIEPFVCVQIPITLQQERGVAELYLFRRKEGGRKIDPENARILVALDLPHMGRLESFVEVLGREVSLQMAVERPGAEEWLRRGSIGLHSALGGIGYKLADTKVGPLREKTTPRTAMAALDAYESGKRAGVDLTV